MAKKTAALNCMVSPEIKQKLKLKAQELGLSITAFLEKVAAEPIIFLDENLKSFTKILNIKIK